MERTELVERLSRAIADETGTIIVAGPSGSGKTTLISQAIERAGRDTRVVACDPLDPAVPYGPIKTLFASIATDALGDLSRSPTAVADAIVGEQAWTVLVVEDVQWIDEASARLIPVLADRIAAAPGCMVLSIDTAEDPEVLDIDSTAVALRLDVPPLDIDEVSQVIPAGLDPHGVLESTGGLALLVAEVAEEGSATFDHRSVVLGRLDRLTLSTRDIVETVAVSPTGSSRSLLDRLHPGWRTNLAPATEPGLVTMNSDPVRISHEMIRRVLVGDLTGMRRRFLHQRILEHLDESSDPAVVAAHADGAGAIETLIEAGWRAALEAERAGSHAEAVGQLERLLHHEYSLEPARRSEVRRALERNRRGR